VPDTVTSICVFKAFIAPSLKLPTRDDAAGRAVKGASSGGRARRSVGVATHIHTRRSATGSRRMGGGGLDAVVDRRDSPHAAPAE
jgi:hypothetical protein